jgi:hypothetical protein
MACSLVGVEYVLNCAWLVAFVGTRVCMHVGEIVTRVYRCMHTTSLHVVFNKNQSIPCVFSRSWMNRIFTLLFDRVGWSSDLFGQGSLSGDLRAAMATPNLAPHHIPNALFQHYWYQFIYTLTPVANPELDVRAAHPPIILLLSLSFSSSSSLFSFSSSSPMIKNC